MLLMRWRCYIWRVIRDLRETSGVDHPGKCHWVSTSIGENLTLQRLFIFSYQVVVPAHHR